MLIACGGAAECENLFIDGAGAEQKLPMQGARCHIECGGNREKVDAAHGMYERGEAYIKAYAESESAEGSIECGGIGSGRQGIGFAEALSALYIDVKHMRLPMAGYRLSRRIIDEASIINSAILDFGHTAAYYVRAGIPRRTFEHTRHAATAILGVPYKRFGGIRTAKHLRQHYYVRAGGFFYQIGSVEYVFAFIIIHAHLYQ